MIDYREDAKWTVYVHIVPKELSGYDVDKKYVGITRQDPQRRWENGHGYKYQMFYNAIVKYGWDNMLHLVLTETNDYNDALYLEEMYIKIFRTNEKKYGYNCYATRDVDKLTNSNYIPSDVCLGKHPQAKPVICLNTLEVFDCLTSAGLKYNADKHHIGECCNGKWDTAGKHPKTNEPLLWEFYDETKEYTIKQYDKNCNGRKVVCLTTNELFSNVRGAEKYYNIKHRGIDRNCNGVKNCRGGAGMLADGTMLQWKYFDKYLIDNNLTDEEARKRLFFVL